MGPVHLEWTKGPFTDHVELFVNNIDQSGLIYRGSSTGFEYTLRHLEPTNFSL